MMHFKQRYDVVIWYCHNAIIEKLITNQYVLKSPVNSKIHLNYAYKWTLEQYMDIAFPNLVVSKVLDIMLSFVDECIYNDWIQEYLNILSPLVSKHSFKIHSTYNPLDNKKIRSYLLYIMWRDLEEKVLHTIASENLDVMLKLQYLLL